MTDIPQVVDREALAEALWERLGFPTEHEWEELPNDAREDWRRDADAILAHLRVADAADVRRAVAEQLLSLIGEEPQPKDEFQKGVWAENRRVRRMVREAGERE